MTLRDNEHLTGRVGSRKASLKKWCIEVISEGKLSC